MAQLITLVLLLKIFCALWKQRVHDEYYTTAKKYVIPMVSRHDNLITVFLCKNTT